MYSLLGRLPEVADFHPRHVLKYEKFALENDSYFKECWSQTMMLEKHDGLLIDHAFPFCPEDHVVETKYLGDKQFFSVAHKTIFDCNSKFYGETGTSSTAVLSKFGLEAGRHRGEDLFQGGFNCDFEVSEEDVGSGEAYYSRCREKLSSTIDLLVSDAQRKWYIDYLSQGRSEAIRMNVREADRTNNGLKSLPSIDTSPSARRLRPPGSPSSSQKRKRKSHG